MKKKDKIDKHVLTMGIIAAMFLTSVLVTTFLSRPISASPAADIVAKKVTESIVVDGMAYESFWQNVSWVQFPLAAAPAGGGSVKSVKVKMVHNGEYLFALFQWSDPTDSNDKLIGPEDRLAVMVSIGTPEMTPCMTGAADWAKQAGGSDGAILAGEADMWHWKAARTDSDGKNFTYVSRHGVGYNMSHPYSFAMDGYVNTSARWREGLSEYTEMNATKYPFEATLHLYDVKAKGTWIGTSEGGQWTLELARKFTTEDPSRIDHQFSLGEEFSFALAVYDGGEGEDEEIKSTTPTWRTAQISDELLVPPSTIPPPVPEWLTYVSVGGLIIAIIALAVSAVGLRKRAGA